MQLQRNMCLLSRNLLLGFTPTLNILRWIDKQTGGWIRRQAERWTAIQIGLGKSENNSLTCVDSGNRFVNSKDSVHLSSSLSILIFLCEGSYVVKKFLLSVLKYDEKKDLFMKSNLGANVIKLFVRNLQTFVLSSRVFVRLDWISLPGTNAIAFYKKMWIVDEKRFVTLSPEHKIQVCEMF